MNRNSPIIDYNFALIPVLFGLIGVFYILTHSKKTLIIILSNLLLLIFTFCILLSGSRRGLMLLMIFIFILIVIQIITLIYKENIFNKLRNVTRYYLGSLLILSLFTYLFVFQTNYNFKNNTLILFGVDNVYLTKHEITSSIFRYFSSFNNNLSYDVFYDKLWTHEFNPKDPESGWGSNNHKLVYPLQGNNYQIVPKDSKGYLMDSSCFANTWDNNAYSSTIFIKHKLEPDVKYISTVYCFVSENFNGEWVRINVVGKTKGDYAKYYDLTKKGEWQKLEIIYKGKLGNASINLSFSKYGVTDFNSLKGYVIFANPTYKIYNSKKTLKLDSIQTGLVNTINLNNENSILSSLKIKIQKASILQNFTPKFPILLIQIEKDTDPIRNWIKNIFNEDSTYYGYNTNIVFAHDPKNIVASRTDRWKFGWIIFTKEYNLKQKIFGNGFDYLNWYGYYFYNDKIKSDWPHNPFISVLLYSGIIGLVLYLYLMYRVIAIYLKYIREYYILFIFFSITFYFSFFSANNPFDPPVMGFFMMLPFLIEYINNKEKRNEIK